MIFSVLLSLMGYVMLLHIVVKHHIELNLFAVIATIVGILHLFTLVGALQFAAHGIFYIGLGCAAISFILYLTNYRPLIKDLFSPGIVLFVVLGFLYWTKFKDLTFGGYDEMINWGLAVKEMLITHQFPGLEGPVSPKAHPRGPNLFQYYFVFNTAYHEGTVYLAHFLFQLSPIMVLFQKISWKKLHWILLLLATVFYFIQAMGVGIISLYVDHILSIYFAMILYVYWISTIEKKYLFLLIPVLFTLPLIKKIGFSLSLFAALLISADLIIQLIRKKRVHDLFSKHLFQAKKKEIIGTFLILSLLLGAPILSYYSWQKRLETIGMNEQFSIAGVSPEQIIHDFSPNASEYKKTVIGKFVEFIEETPFTSNSDKEKVISKIEQLTGILVPQSRKLVWTAQLSLRDWMLLITFVYLCAFILQPNKESKLKLVLIYGCLVSGFLIFLFTLLLHYMYSFTSYEALRMASSNRYASILFISICLMGFGFLYQFENNNSDQKTKKWKKSSSVANLLGIIIVVGLYILETPASRGIFSRQGYSKIRNSLQPQIQFIKSKISSSASVYVVYQNSPEGHISVIHDLFPIKTSTICNSLGTPYSPEEPWTCNISSEEWEKLIIKEESDYVFLAKADNQFWERYEGVFEEGTQLTDFLFQVQKNSMNHVLLSPIR